MTVFSRFLRLHHRHCPRITISVSLLRALLFLAQDQNGQSQAHLAHLGCRSEQRIRLILHTGTASDIIRDVTKRGTVAKAWDLFNFNTRNNKLQNLKNFKVAQFWLHSVKLQAPEEKKKKNTFNSQKRPFHTLFFSEWIMITPMTEKNSECLFCLLLNYPFNKGYKEQEFHKEIFFVFENDHNSWDEFHVFI